MRKKTPFPSKIGLLLIDAATKEQVAIIEFDPSGTLIVHSLRQEMHVFALKSLHRLLTETVLTAPLYEKYAQVLEKQSSLPAEILEQEAKNCAYVLNQREAGLTVGCHTVFAKLLHYDG